MDNFLSFLLYIFYNIYAYKLVGHRDQDGELGSELGNKVIHIQPNVSIFV